MLPPGREPDDDPLPRPGRPEAPEDRHVDADIATFVAEADDVVAQVPREPTIGEPVVPNVGSNRSKAVEFEMPAIDAVVAMPEVEELVSKCPSLRKRRKTLFSSLSSSPSFEPAEVEVAALATAEAGRRPSVASEYGALSFTDDINDARLRRGDDARVRSCPRRRSATATSQDFDALLRDLGGAPTKHSPHVDDAPSSLPPVRDFAPTEALPSMDFDIAPSKRRRAKEAQLSRLPDFSSLSLEALNDAPAATHAARRPTRRSPPQFKQTSRPRRIASLELNEDRRRWRRSVRPHRAEVAVGRSRRRDAAARS